MRVTMRLLTVLGMVPLLSLGACRDMDYSQMPFYDDVFVKQKEEVDNSRRIPAEQPVREWNYQKPPDFEKNWGASGQRGALEPQYQDMLPKDVRPQPSEKFADTPSEIEMLIAAKLGTAKTEMHEVAPAEDPTLFSDEPFQLKPFAYDNSPRINEPKVKTAADVAAENATPDDGGTYFREDVAYNAKTLRGGYLGKNFYGNSYFRNE